MELTWLMKLRIASAAVIGVVLIGIISWPSESPPDPFGSLVLNEIGTHGAVTLLIMAFIAGLVSYFAAWPYGREIGILAVPFGLSLWAIKTGSTGGLMQLNPAAEQRMAILSVLRWEPFFWLLVFAVGFGGVLLGQMIVARLKKEKSPVKTHYSAKNFMNGMIAFVLSGLISIFCIKIFAQDTGVFDGRVGSVVAQPQIGQVVYAVLLSFGIASFVAKAFLNANYNWPIISSIIVTFFSVSTYMKQAVMSHFVEHWPSVFLPNAAVSILPIQMVTFGIIGSIAGYWAAVRYIYWRKHEM